MPRFRKDGVGWAKGRQGTECGRGWHRQQPRVCRFCEFPWRFCECKLIEERDSPEDDLEREAQKPVLLAPIRVELDTETHRIRDYFTWNVNGEYRVNAHIAD